MKTCKRERERVRVCVSVRVIEKERENYLVFSQLSSTMPRAEYNSNPPLSQKPDDDDIKRWWKKAHRENCWRSAFMASAPKSLFKTGIEKRNSFLLLAAATVTYIVNRLFHPNVLTLFFP